MKQESFSVIEPRLKLISERIMLVRKNRGLKAEGDVLLQAALRSVASKDRTTAKRDITKFLQIIPNLKPDERAILTNVEARLLNNGRFDVVSLIIQVLNWLVLFLLKLVSKTPMGYKFSGNIFRFIYNDANT